MALEQASSEASVGSGLGMRETKAAAPSRPWERLRHWWAQHSYTAPRSHEQGGFDRCSVEHHRGAACVWEPGPSSSAASFKGTLPPPVLPCTTAWIVLCPQLPQDTPPSHCMSSPSLLRSTAHLSPSRVSKQARGLVPAKKGRNGHPLKASPGQPAGFFSWLCNLEHPTSPLCASFLEGGEEGSCQPLHSVIPLSLARLAGPGFPAF